MPEVKCIVCGKVFTVSDAQKQLMDKIGPITCGHKCAMEWIERD